MPLTMTAKMDTWIRAQGCKRCKDTGRIECYRDADEDCPDCSPRRKLLAELDAQAAAHQETIVGYRTIEAMLGMLGHSAAVDEDVLIKTVNDKVSKLVTAHQETQAKLELRTGCAKCKGLGFTERHQPGHTHYETEGECPAYHFEKVPCISCGTGTVANNKQLAETQAIVRELLKALEKVIPGIRLDHDSGNGIFSTREVQMVRAAIARAKGVLPAGDTAGTGTR